MSETPSRAARVMAPIDRRGFFWIGWASIAAASAGFLVSTFRFLVPNVLYEPPSRFGIGLPTDFPPGSATGQAPKRFAAGPCNRERRAGLLEHGNGQARLYP